jgi:metal-responsive CopG/Arc/MetJ family transcriptional regulator
MKRGVVRAAESEFLGVWIPKPLVVLMESAMADCDRSKFIRAALRERIARKQAKKVCSDRELLKS